MKFQLLLLFIFSFFVGKAQQYTLQHEIQLPEGKFTTDPLGNIYSYNRGDVTKFSQEGLELNRYSTRDYGLISHVDASNPLKILVVFQEFSMAVVLDASLGQNSTFDLTSTTMPFVKLLCSSRESGYWYFDPVEKRLKKISDQLIVTREGTPMRQISEEPLEPSQIFDSGNWLIMNVPEYGFLVFDRFGTYYKTIPVTTRHSVQANGDDILFKENEQMTLIDIKTGITRSFVLPENDPSDECRVEGSHIFLRKNNVLKIYSY